MKRLILAASLIATSFAVVPASAQYWGGGYGYGAPRVYEEEYDYAPRRRYEYDAPRREYYGRPRYGSTCVTARGVCPTRPAPHATPCGCEIPGFGFKRGAVN